jgi:hypothetical protein
MALKILKMRVCKDNDFSSSYQCKTWSLALKGHQLQTFEKKCSLKYLDLEKIKEECNLGY